MVHWIDSSVLVYLIVYNVFVHSLVQLPHVEDNNIEITEKIIRNTVNNIFGTLKIKDVRNKHKFKHLSIIHNFFVSITLKDCDNLNEIAKLTRVNNVDNYTQLVITQINEVLDERDNGHIATDDTDLNRYVDVFITRLKYLKLIHGLSEDVQVNPNVINHLNNGINDSETKVFHSEDNVLSSIEFWRPSYRRIYQGHRVRIKEYPFMASVHFFNEFKCSGSIIKSDLVITSSSCLQLAWNNRFYRENPSFLSVRIGSDFSQIGGELIPVLEINFHPKYDPKSLNHNIALMRLGRRINFKSSRRVKKIDIDRKPKPLSEARTGRVTVVGWGARDMTNVIQHPLRNRLAYDELDYYPHDDCREIYKKNYVTRRHFCAGFISKGGGACNFDAGGPGIIGDVLVGVISFGAVGCGAADSPTVFTKIGFYAEWIDEIMDQYVPKTYRLQHTLTKHPIRPRFSMATHTSPLKMTPVNLGTTKQRIFPKLLREEDSSPFEDFMNTMFKVQETVTTQTPKVITTMKLNLSSPKIFTTLKSTTTTVSTKDIFRFTSALEDFNIVPKRNKPKETRIKNKSKSDKTDVNITYPSGKDFSNDKHSKETRDILKVKKSKKRHKIQQKSVTVLRHAWQQLTVNQNNDMSLKENNSPGVTGDNYTKRQIEPQQTSPVQSFKDELKISDIFTDFSDAEIYRRILNVSSI